MQENIDINDHNKELEAAMSGDQSPTIKRRVSKPNPRISLMKQGTFELSTESSKILEKRISKNYSKDATEGASIGHGDPYRPNLRQMQTSLGGSTDQPSN